MVSVDILRNVRKHFQLQLVQQLCCVCSCESELVKDIFGLIYAPFRKKPAIFTISIYFLF